MAVCAVKSNEAIQTLTKRFGENAVKVMTGSVSLGLNVLIPDSNGSYVQSNLYKSIKDITGNNITAWDIYTNFYSKSFIDNHGDWLNNPSDFNIDENGELVATPTIINDVIQSNIIDSAVNVPVNENEVQYNLKAVTILLSDKAKQIFDKGNKNNWDLNKILTELAIPKEQKQLLLDLGINNREQLAIELASKYGYSVEVNTAKTNEDNQVKQLGDNEEFTFAGSIYEYKNNEYLKDNDIIDIIEYESAKHEVFTNPNTSYYSNLTVPGGTNYTENEISTPLITPSIKGHAQFSTDQGIGWFRSDEQVKEGTQKRPTEGTTIPNIQNDPFDSQKPYRGGEATKTRRIQEVQSDLFQKWRNKFIFNNVKYNITEDTKRDKHYFKDGTEISSNEYNKDWNSFLNTFDNESDAFVKLLQREDNWVTFFIKSIIQDSAKKGYEKVLFPKGETAAKIEGHQSLANRIEEIDEAINNTDKYKTFNHSEDSFEWKITSNIGGEYITEYSKEDFIATLSKEKQELKAQGIEKLKPVEAFYEIKVGNILEKQFGKENVKTITDEYGNQWREITINQERDTSPIVLQKETPSNNIRTLVSKLFKSSSPKYVNDFNNKKQITLDELLNYLYDNGTPLVKILITKLKTFNIPNDVIINLFNNTEVRYELLDISPKDLAEASNILGYHYLKNKKNKSGLSITFNTSVLSNSQFILTALHELVHLYTLNGYTNASTELKQEMDDLFISAKAKLIESKLLPEDYYELTDVKEFMTGVFSDYKLQKALSKLPSDKKEFNTLWEEFIDFLKKLFNLSSDEATLLDEAMSKVADVMESQSNYYRDFKAREINDAITNEINPNFKKGEDYFNYVMKEWESKPKGKGNTAIYTYYSIEHAQSDLNNINKLYKNSGVSNIQHIPAKEKNGRDIWRIYVSKPNPSAYIIYDNNINETNDLSEYNKWYDSLSEQDKISEEARLLNNSEKDDISFKRTNKRKVKINTIPVTDEEITMNTQRALRNVIARLSKRAVIIQAKGKEVSVEDKKELKTLEDAYATSKYFQGLSEFVTNTNDSLDDQIDRMLDIIERINNSEDLLPPEGMGKLIREAYTYFSAIEPIIEGIRGEMGESFMQEIKAEFAKAKMDVDPITIMKEMEKNLSILKGKVDKLSSLYYKAATPIFAEFLGAFVGQSGILPDEIENMLKSTDNDISFWQRWLFSMAETSDVTLRLFNEAVGRAKEKSRLATIQLKRELLNDRDELIKNNITDYDWMFDTSNGEITGYFIDLYKWDDFIQARTMFYAKLKHDFNIKEGTPIHDQLTQAQLKDYNKRQAKWYKDNTKFNKQNLTKYLELKKKELGNDLYNDWINNPKHIKRNEMGDIVGVIDTIITDRDVAVMLPADKYTNNDYVNLSTEKLNFLNKIISIKQELDSHLPAAHRSKLLIPQIRKDVIERAKQLKSMSSARQLAKEIIDDYNVADELDRGYDIKQSIITDVTGKKQVDLLPVKFTKKLKDPNINLSKDIIGSMIIYAGMANDFKEINSIIDILELGKQIMQERQLAKEASPGNIATEVINIFGKKIENKITTKSEGSNAYNRLEDYFQMVVYGKYKKTTNKTIFGKDQEKMLDLLGKYTAINGLALNLFAGIANVAFGEMMMGIEARAGEFINDKSLAKGTLNYGKHLGSALNDIGKVKSTSKLNLWLEYFNTFQEFESDIHEVDTTRKTRISRLFRLSSLFFINNAGEHWMQARLSLALAEEHKVLDSTGAQISLFDAFDVKDGVLSLKEGVTKLDGSEWTQDDTIAFIRKQNFINKRMHGIYNYADRAAIQQYALGRLALMFRKYLVPSINRRYLKKQYNFEGDVYTEGYYNTSFRFIKLLFTELKQGQYSILKSYNTLDAYEKANVKRFATEVVMLIAIALLAAFVFDDDDNDSWGFNLMAYETNRLMTELGAYNPVTAISEGFKLVKTPAASVGTLQSVYGFGQSLIFNTTDEITKGKFEGWYRWQRDGFKLIPGAHQLYDLTTPEEKLKYFTFTK